MSIILASLSPRRKELLGFITKDFEVIVSDADENISKNLSPKEAVIEIAKRKGMAVAENTDKTIISADTIVVLGDKILGKPKNSLDAYNMLCDLSDNTHSVYTGVFVKSAEKEISFVHETKVSFYPLSKEDIDNYIATGEPFDKAGAYGIQGQGSLFVKSIEGDYFNVVGLPIARLNRVLKENNLL